MNASHLPPEALDEWAAAAAQTLGVTDVEVPTELILNVASDAAHGVARPAAPISTFLLGIAYGRSGGSPEALRRAAQELTARAESWSTSE